jgi:hypothetical protein
MIDPECGGGVPLRVDVQDQDVQPCLGHRRRNVHRRRRLADAALLVRDGDDPRAGRRGEGPAHQADTAPGVLGDLERQRGRLVDPREAAHQGLPLALVLVGGYRAERVTWWAPLHRHLGSGGGVAISIWLRRRPSGDIADLVHSWTPVDRWLMAVSSSLPGSSLARDRLDRPHGADRIAAVDGCFTGNDVGPQIHCVIPHRRDAAAAQTAVAGAPTHTPGPPDPGLAARRPRRPGRRLIRREECRRPRP